MRGLNCLSNWYRPLSRSGVPTPPTLITVKHNLRCMLDGAVPDGWDHFIKTLKTMGSCVGYPCFLRTGETSGKHQWRNTCFVSNPDDLPQHIFNLVEFSECADMLGLPYNVWVVRQMLPVEPITTLPWYNHFPLVREVRAFVFDGKKVCAHPYWPHGSIEKGAARDADPKEVLDWYRQASYLSNQDSIFVDNLIHKVAEAFLYSGFGWSVDLLHTKLKNDWGGWVVTDMAVAKDSYHETSCPHYEKFKVQESSR